MEAVPTTPSDTELTQHVKRFYAALPATRARVGDLVAGLPPGIRSPAERYVPELAPGSRQTQAAPLVQLTRRGNAPNRSQAARAAGLSRDQKREALRLAHIPEAEFEAAIEYRSRRP